MANDRSIPRHGGEAEPIPPRRPQAPSRARWAAANPPHTVRFKLKTYNGIVASCERLGISFNQRVNIAVDELDDAAMEVIHAHGYEHGFREGVNHDRAERAAAYAESAAKFWVTLPCPKCGRPIECRGASAQSLVSLLAIPEFWAHEICPSPAAAPSGPTPDVR